MYISPFQKPITNQKPIQMAIKKQFLKSKPECKVTFSVEAEQFPNAEAVAVAGNFNDWSAEAHPMKKFKNGNFRISFNLPVDQEHEFKYVVDGEEWVNETEADKLVSDNIAGQNSVLVL